MADWSRSTAILAVCSRAPGLCLYSNTIHTGDNGNTVHSLLADYHGLDFGEQGWLRIMKFIPRKNEIEVSVYSKRLKKIMGTGDDKYSIPPMNNSPLD